MLENERDFKEMIAGLDIDAEPNPAHRERLRRQMLGAFEAAGRSTGSEEGVDPSRALRWPVAWVVRLAAAAVIVIAATVGIHQWVAGTGRGPATLSQVLQATQEMPWLHSVASEYRDGEVRTEQHWCNFAAQQAYVLASDGGVLCWDFGPAHRKSVYSPRMKVLAISELPDQGLFGADAAYDLVDAFATFASQNDVTLEQWPDQYEGKKVRAYQIEKGDPGIRFGNRTVARVRIKLMADPETRRVVAADIRHRDATGVTLSREEWVMSYPQSGPRNVYDLGVPDSVRIVDRTSQTIGTPGDTPRPVPTPSEPGRSQMVPLQIDLPRPMFVGTPQNNRVPRLEKPRRGPRPPFLAPTGTMNVALGKPVACSDADPVMGTPDMITDGDKAAADGSFVELGPGRQHVTVDLQDRYEIYAVLVWHYHQQPRVYFDVVAQVSDDADFKRAVTTVFNNDIDNSLGLGRGQDMHYTETNEGKLIDTKGIRGRYVRLYSQGNTSEDLNHYIEIEVYGRPVP